MTEDSDFVKLLEEFGPPPQVIWLTCGNTTNARLKQILTKALPEAISLLESGSHWSKYVNATPLERAVNR
jgi:predicted nuclease of predicted toxin-antitoxin system